MTVLSLKARFQIFISIVDQSFDLVAGAFKQNY